MIPKFLLWLLFNQCILAQATECDWVRIIYEKMGGNVLHIPEDCCTMIGIHCAFGRIARIDWSNEELTGTIPPELGNLIVLSHM
jgi:hypothetical protein